MCHGVLSAVLVNVVFVLIEPKIAATKQFQIVGRMGPVPALCMKQVDFNQVLDSFQLILTQTGSRPAQFKAAEWSERSDFCCEAFVHVVTT